MIFPKLKNMKKLVDFFQLKLFYGFKLHDFQTLTSLNPKDSSPIRFVRTCKAAPMGLWY